MPPLGRLPPSKRRIFERSSCGRWKKESKEKTWKEREKKKSRINMPTSPREKWRSSIIASVGENETFFSFPYAFGRV